MKYPHPKPCYLFMEVKELYRLVGFDSKNPANDCYVDAWDIRRLYTFAWRRQNDAAKRKQVPRDWGGQKLFECLQRKIDKITSFGKLQIIFVSNIYTSIELRLDILHQFVQYPAPIS